MRTFLDYKFGKNSERGFSLLELIIAVLVLGVVVSIALPALTRSRLNANDELAKTTVRTVATAFETYRAAAQPPSYPLTLLDLTAATPPYIDLSLTTDSSLTKSGHDCSILATGANTFSFKCSPTTDGTTGAQHVCIKETGEVFTSATGFTAGCIESVGTTTTTTTTSTSTSTSTGPPWDPPDGWAHNDSCGSESGFTYYWTGECVCQDWDFNDCCSGGDIGYNEDSWSSYDGCCNPGGTYTGSTTSSNVCVNGVNTIAP